MIKISHFYIEPFFASPGQPGNPELIGEPVSVGGNSER